MMKGCTGLRLLRTTPLTFRTLVRMDSGAEGLYPAVDLVNTGGAEQVAEESARVAQALRVRGDAPAARDDATAVGSTASYKAIAGYNARSAREVSFAAGDVVQLIEQLSNDWLEVRDVAGRTGIAPSNHLECVRKYVSCPQQLLVSFVPFFL